MAKTHGQGAPAEDAPVEELDTTPKPKRSVTESKNPPNTTEVQSAQPAITDPVEVSEGDDGARDADGPLVRDPTMRIPVDVLHHSLTPKRIL